MNKYEVASTRYQKIIDFLEHEISLKGEQKSLINSQLTLDFPLSRRQRAGEKSPAPGWPAEPLPVLSEARQVDRGEECL